MRAPNICVRGFPEQPLHPAENMAIGVSNEVSLLMHAPIVSGRLHKYCRPRVHALRTCDERPKPTAKRFKLTFESQESISNGQSLGSIRDKERLSYFWSYHAAAELPSASNAVFETHATVHHDLHVCYSNGTFVILLFRRYYLNLTIDISVAARYHF